MGNLGGYQKAVQFMKAMGGPGKALAIGLAVVGTAGYGVIRLAEAGGKKGIAKLKASRASRPAPCEAKGRTFIVDADGTDDQGLEFRAGMEYEVLECDGDAVLVKLADEKHNPYMVSGRFLSTVSAFPSTALPEEN